MTPSQTAIHEAGHAVIARVLGLPAGYATIVPDEDAGSEGYAITPDWWVIQGHWDSIGRWRSAGTAIRARILSSMAGADAEIEFFGRCAGGDGDDRQRIDEMLNSLLGPVVDPAPVAARLRRFSAALVRRHRNAIADVAEALMVHRHLTAEQIDALVPGTEERNSASHFSPVEIALRAEP